MSDFFSVLVKSLFKLMIVHGISDVHICLEAVKQASAVAMDLWNMSRLMAGTVAVWSHLSRRINFIGCH
jgi:hypothetical protein